jgi:rhamnosyltransferase subunit B
MKIIITAVGSTGDVYPFLAIARLLRRQGGYEVLVVANERFRAQAEAAGLEFHAHGTAKDYGRSITPPRGSLKNPFVLLQGAKDLLEFNFFKPIGPTFDAIAEHRGSGALIIGHGASFGARLARDAFNLPMVSGVLSPTAIPGNAYGQLSQLIMRIGNAVCTRNINRFCAERGLPRRKTVAGWSLSPDRIAALFPAFFDEQADTWPDNVTAVGYQRFDTDGELDEETRAFLKQGPTVLFTSGTPIRTAHRLFQAGVEVCRTLRLQGLFVTDYRGQVPAALPGFIAHHPYVSFRGAFPLCAAIVHHGGVGTSLEGLLAGVPQLVAPQIVDQHFDGARLKELGVAEVLPMSTFNAARATPLLKSLLESGAVKENCRINKQRLEKDDAEKRMLRLVEGILAGRFGKR